ncbi:hypothetical protein L2E82_34827 [Cichorium intybus]|uniref:Uncharacterized protein n=1 Tax=Cichorium intybus TaxID=13427 RepID=A0ACB9BMS4_CICIN|nr:hypothetical protein L2E82_34827 [Cichorium intybus]
MGRTSPTAGIQHVASGVSPETNKKVTGVWAKIRLTGGELVSSDTGDSSGMELDRRMKLCRWMQHGDDIISSSPPSACVRAAILFGLDPLGHACGPLAVGLP